MAKKCCGGMKNGTAGFGGEYAGVDKKDKKPPKPKKEKWYDKLTMSNGLDADAMKEAVRPFEGLPPR